MLTGRGEPSEERGVAGTSDVGAMDNAMGREAAAIGGRDRKPTLTAFGARGSAIDERKAGCKSSFGSKGSADGAET
eukprot:scaffold164558_cov51-Attheya_sp.AAC.2